MKRKFFLRLLGVFLAAVLLLGILACLPFSVSAETEGDFEYTIENGEATITGYTGKGGDVVIPSTLGGYPVTEIGYCAFLGCTGLTSVEIPEGVIIEEGAFSGCTGLTSLVIPDGVVARTWAFAGCTGLTSVTFGKDTVIGMAMFQSCTGLTSVSIGGGDTGINSYAFIDCINLVSITVDEGNLNYYASGNCIIDKDTGILVVGCKASVIPEGVTEIGYFAFAGQTGLTQIDIPDSVTLIDDSAFADCTGLTSIEIPEGVTAIWMSAFWGCTGLTSIEIPVNVKKMSHAVFYGCENLTDIYCLASEEPEGWAKPDEWGNGWLDGCDAVVHWGEAMPKPALAIGDLGGNGKIDATDYLILKRAVLGTFTLTEEQKAAADINGDGKINSVDYMLLKRVVLGTYKI